VVLVLGYLLALAAESHAAADLPFPFVAVLEWSVTGVLVVVTGGYWFERGTGHALAVILVDDVVCCPGVGPANSADMELVRSGGRERASGKVKFTGFTQHSQGDPEA
jgi:hypothetical protein